MKEHIIRLKLENKALQKRIENLEKAFTTLLILMNRERKAVSEAFNARKTKDQIVDWVSRPIEQKEKEEATKAISDYIQTYDTGMWKSE